MANLEQLLKRKSLLDKELKKTMPPKTRRDLAALRLATELRIELRKKRPELDASTQPKIVLGRVAGRPRGVTD